MKSIGVVFIAGGLIVVGLASASSQTVQQTGLDAGAIERYLTHVSTDKPIYRTGEKVYVRGVLLDAHGHTPIPRTRNLTGGTAFFEIKGPKGDTVTSGLSTIIDSTLGFSWDIPASQAGGEYTIRITHPSGDPPAERKFDIRAYRAPRLKSQIVFVRDGYGPGDTVAANLHVERAEGGVPAGARVSITARVDGEEAWKSETIIDAAGNAAATFKLPKAIARGEGVLAMTIQDGGIVETATKTIPILLQTIDLAIYPEGGDLVAGLPNRVYIESRTPAQKPADVAGVVVNAAGRQIAAFRTEHEGRGRFSFTPARGGTYFLRITEPAGIKTVFHLPSVKDRGVVISSLTDIVERHDGVVLRVAANVDGTYRVVLSQRGKELTFKTFAMHANWPVDVTFAVPKSVDGVIVATVYDERKTPVAERLLFRQPDRSLNVQIVADRSDYVPGDKVTLRVTTTDDSGKPVGAVVGLTVTDSSVLEMIEKREQAPRLPVMVLLENDVKNLADAHLYLDERDPKAPLATDLLLGTQGWRRFATVDFEKFLAAYSDAARRALVVLGTGSVDGVVRDSTAAFIPGVRVQATNMLTGATLTQITSQSGRYAFRGLEPGRYQVSALLPGFRTETVTGLKVATSGSVRHDFRLEVDAVAMRFEFRAAQPAVDAVLAPRENDLPIVDKNAFDLVDSPLEFRNEQNVVEAELQKAQIGQRIARDAFAERADFARENVMAKLMTVREYAHTLRADWTPGSRTDFAETVYWNAGIRTDASSGRATVSFNLSDSVTSFRVLADGFTQDGTLGSGVTHVESVQPFSIEPKIPLQVTAGDVIHVPIGVINGMSRELRGVDIAARGPDRIGFNLIGDYPSALRARERTRRLLRIDVGDSFTGIADITLDARAGLYRDSVTRRLDVQPLGFPYEISSGGMLESNGTKSFEFTLPSEIVRGSTATSVTVYPTPLASMADALQSLIREPNGCFEQTSSTSYPMVMAQQYFLTHTGIDPAIVNKTRDLLEASYKRLTGFETRTKGYEWFGADPGHEALTAYGLMQFTDMSEVRAVDKEMLERTRAWLLSRRDGKGGFSRNPRALDSFGGAPADTTNAYIVWALIESGEKGLDREVAAVKASANATKDSYIVALAASILHSTGDRAAARQLMDRLAKNQDTTGKIKGAETSITRSGGDALAIETTALSVLAWLREPEYAAHVQNSLRWIVESNKSGRFGSTQSTILALRAIVAYDAAHARPKAPGRLVLVVDGKTVDEPLKFTADSKGALVLPDFGRELGPGRHTVVLRMEEGSSMPYSVSVKYHSTLPDSDARAQVGIGVVLTDTEIQEGSVTEATVSIANKSDRVIPTPVAIVGIPGGLEVRHDQLKELVKSGRIDAYEVIGREVVLYWRYLKASDKFDLPLSLIAAVPGSYTGPASRAYLYYTDEYKSWAPGLKVNIMPR